MKGSVFEFLDYKKYLEGWIATRTSGGRGERSRIAATLRCNVAYISRILNGPADLSLEQAHALNAYLGHSAEEADFFLLLVLLGRAGTAELKAYYLAKVRAEVERKSALKNRLEHRKLLSSVDKTTFFSAWYYSAIHLLLAIPELQTRENIARYLGLSLKKVGQVLEFLVVSGLATEKNGRYQTGATNIHLGADSPLISKHHANWRLQALQSLERDRADDLHYSSSVTISKKHVPEIREVLVTAIEKIRAIVRDSPEEALYCYSLDLFEIGGGSPRA